jgi:cytochrome c peroxidase
LTDFRLRVSSVAGLLVGLAGCAQQPADDTFPDEYLDPEVEMMARSGGTWGDLPNNFPILNEHGLAATYSTQGAVDLDGEYHTPQGTNGRHCGSCHAIQDGWTQSALTTELTFLLTLGTDPLFDPRDSDRGVDANGDPVDDLSTFEGRADAFSMLRKAKHRRSQSVPANAEFQVIDVDDPFESGSTSRFIFFRRSLPTANFGQLSTQWDGANTQATLEEGLARQVRGNITGAQQGTAPVDEAVVADIVDFEIQLFHAQTYVWGVGFLNADGGLGGPEHRANQPLVAGPFNLYDAWENHANPLKAAIFRGQEIFNNQTRPNGGGACRGCHNAENDGQNVNGTFFNIGTARPEFAEPDMALYTLQNIATGEILVTSDGCRGWRTGLWADLERCKTPSLRGVGSRGSYFRNGIAETLEEVVEHYEVALGFVFTDQERDDLVAFLEAL